MTRPLTIVLASLALVGAAACGADRRPTGRGDAGPRDGGGGGDGGSDVPDGAADDAPAAGTARVTGTVQLVNAPGGSSTSVVLVPEEGFVPDAPRDSLPAGPRADGVTGPFAIAGVPAGRWYVLVAWERDGLVLDPGSDGEVALVDLAPDGATDVGTVQVTSALEVYGPGAAGVETVTTPDVVLRWEDDGAEDQYDVAVVGEDGTLLWNVVLPAVTGAAEVTTTVPGEALVAGSTHGFRAVSTRAGAPISSTEPLAGIFVYSP